MLHCFSITPKLSKKSSTDCNPPAAPKQSFLYHPDSLENKATLMCQRKTVHRKRNVYREEDEKPEAKAGPKKGGGKLRGEGDVLIKVRVGGGGCEGIDGDGGILCGPSCYTC